MINITEALYVYFRTSENQGLSQRMLRDVRAVARRYGCDFGFDVDELKFYLHHYKADWTPTRIQTVWDELCYACYGITLMPYILVIRNDVPVVQTSPITMSPSFLLSMRRKTC